MGGDEFAVLVPDATAARGRRDRATGSPRALREPVDVGGHELLVGASIGIADAHRHRPTRCEVLRRADVAMYAAKGRRRPALPLHAPTWTTGPARTPGSAPSCATALDTGQFRLVYQPIVALPDGRIRSRRGAGPLAAPGARAASARPTSSRSPSSNGLIVELGAWILRTACAAGRELAGRRSATGAPTKISVNVSARQLAEPGFAERGGRGAGRAPACRPTA